MLICRSWGRIAVDLTSDIDKFVDKFVDIERDRIDESLLVGWIPIS